ncbi:pentapeptide repeat protein [Candidatus Protofrankia californiensis]|uniref:Pentapeptide repeat protein n=1 Tax=Candidatus Protofrankia californiensis TaxID=1839754 RepID=A0A1C3NXC3_9ACTN|nr:pentapeptide repeat protein [Candidatus Protofrankia californiensis]
MTDSRGSTRRAGRRWLWAVAGLAGFGAVMAVVGIWHLPARMYPGAGDGAVQARAALQGGLLTAAAALLAVAGALVALDETRQANAEVRRANENTHVRELYVEAVKLLNDADRGIRLAGIFALERIATDSPADQGTVVEVLSAFVRDRSTDPLLRPPAPADSDSSVPAERPAADIRAAVQVLARLPVDTTIPRSDLAGANLTGPAALSNLAFNDHADLTGAWLDRVDLAGATLSMADLTGAVLAEADLTDVTLIGANLTGAVLVGANLTDATLIKADLTRAMLAQANLTNAELGGAELTRAMLLGANLTRAILFGANLVDAEWLTQEQINVALGDGQTRLPRGIVRPASWSEP